ncbi:MAG: hypothetical protein AB1664_00765 [Thermodesulfobacteriota bacterium]
MIREESRRSKNKAIERDILNCLIYSDDASWICQPRSLGEKLAKDALKAMEERLKESRGAVQKNE